MFVSALPDPTCNSEKSANGGNKQILFIYLFIYSLLIEWGWGNGLVQKVIRC